MIEFLLTFVFLLLMVLAMSVGVIYGRKPISGTCGGLNNLGVGGVCELCGGSPDDCQNLDEPKNKQGKGGNTSAEYYDASV